MSNVMDRALREDFEPWALQGLLRGHTSVAEVLDEERQAAAYARTVQNARCFFNGNADFKSFLNLRIELAIEGSQKPLEKFFSDEKNEKEFNTFLVESVFVTLHHFHLIPAVPSFEITEGYDGGNEKGVYVLLKGTKGCGFEAGKPTPSNLLSAALKAVGKKK